jgi:hypothetical protein
LILATLTEDKVVKNRVHLDLHVSGGGSVPLEVQRRRVEAEADRLVGEGATRMPVPAKAAEVDHASVQLQDPEGDEFCLN